MHKWIAAVCAVLASCASQSGSGLTIRAERVNWCGLNWRSSFSARSVTREVEDSCVRVRGYEQHFVPTRQQWEAVQREIIAVDFATLPERIYADPRDDGLIPIVTDDPESCLEIRHHRVCGESYQLSHSRDGARFLRIWSALAAIAPEPTL